MSSEYLAEVVMPDPPPEEEEEQLIPESVPPEEEVEEIDYDEDEDPPPAVPMPTKKEKIPQDEIFTAPKVKSILDPEVPPSLVGLPQKKPKQTRKKRGPATPEQLERLAKGRAKAAETRARKKAEREKKIALEKEDKELVEAVRDKERKKLRKKLELDEDIPPTKAPPSTPIIVEKGYSQKDLDDAVQRAVQQSVEKVEVLRKQRKEIKKKTMAKANHEAKVFHEINTAMKPSGWDQCFF